MAESVDALVSNTNVRKDVPVRPRLRVPKEKKLTFLQPAADEIRAQHKRLSGPVFVGCHSGLGLEEFVE